MAEQLTNDIVTTLFASITDVEASLRPTSNAGWPTTGQFRVLCQVSESDDSEREIMLVAGGAGPTYTILDRHIEDTSPSAHAAGSCLALVLTAASITQFVEDELGESGFVVVDVAEGQIPVGQSDGSLAGSPAFTFDDNVLHVEDEAGFGVELSSNAEDTVSFEGLGPIDDVGFSFSTKGRGGLAFVSPATTFTNAVAEAGEGLVVTLETGQGNVQTGDVGVVLKAHREDTDEAIFSVLMRGNEGPTPSTTISAPGYVEITTPSAMGFTSNGVFYFSGVSEEDGANFQLQTFLNSQIGPVGFTLNAHHDESDDAVFGLFMRGDQGPTPDTTMEAPGAFLVNAVGDMVFHAASYYGFMGSVDGNDLFFEAINESDTADSAVGFSLATAGDNATGPARFILGVHDAGPDNRASFVIHLAGDEGPTPTTTVTAPGVVQFVTSNGSLIIGPDDANFLVQALSGENPTLIEGRSDTGYVRFQSSDEDNSPAIELYSVGPDPFGQVAVKLGAFQGETNEFQFAVAVDENGFRLSSYVFDGDIFNEWLRIGLDNTVTWQGLGAAFVFAGASGYGFDNTIEFNDGAGHAVLSGFLDDGVYLFPRTIGDGVTDPVAIAMQVHSEGADDAVFIFSMAGDQGATPDVTQAFPGGQGIYIGASGYSFDATVSATAFTVNGNPGVSGTIDLTKVATVENGIITAIT